ncbi:MAG TPA: ABC transporter ATP-binding protein [Candidatus Paceibacterota bacterium]
MAVEQRNKNGAWKILFRHIKEHKASIILVAILGIFSALANGTGPFIMGSFLDSLIDTGSMVNILGITLATWSALLVLWAIVQSSASIIDWIIDRKGRGLRLAMQFGYQSQAFIHLLSLPLSFHKNEKIGEMTDLIGRVGWQISSITDNILIRLTPPVLSVIVGIIVTLLINPIFTLILIIGVILYVLTLVKLLAPATDFIKETHLAWSQSFADAYQALWNVQSVKHMTAEKHESQKIKNNFMNKIVGSRNRIELLWSNMDFYQRIIVLITQIVIFLTSIYLIQHGDLTIGELVALNAYAGLLFGPFIILGHSWQILQDGLAAIVQTEKKIFDVPIENYTPPNAYTPEKINGEVVFDKVSFSYNDSTEVLKKLNFKVGKGEKVALVGKSGVGKSTAIDLISGYYFPTEGKVLVDGHDTREFDLHALRRGIAIVPQEPILFNDTVMMNIRYGKLQATDDEVIEAAKKAYAHDFIKEFPKKYDQLVGERGIKLSVGQKQRIAIARAILRNPSILILDEPTSALDAETESFLAKTFEELMKGRTTFIIAHRLSTVRKADKIIVMDKGRVVETGTHDELIKKKSGLYRKFYDLQIDLR